MSLKFKDQDIDTFDLTGYTQLTDFGVYKLCKNIKANPMTKCVKLNQTRINACKFVSLWSLVYLNKACGKRISDLARPGDKELPVSRLRI